MSEVKFGGGNSSTRLNADYERLHIVDTTRAFIILHDTSLSSILFHIKCRVVPRGQRVPAACWTNGVHIFLADEFFTWEREQRCAAIIHEMNHIAFRHVQRCFSLCEFPRLMNVATDAVINSSMDTEVKNGRAWCQLPGEYITLRKVIDDKDLYNTDVADWNSHKVYIYLLNKSKEDFEYRYGPLGSQSGNERDDLHKAVEDYLEKLLGKNNYLRDDITRDSETEPTINNPIQDALWKMRVERAIGSNPNSLMSRITKDFEESKTPWHKILRVEMKKHCMPETVTTYRKANRLMAVLDNDIFIPGYEPRKGLDNAVFIMDSSGSCFSEGQQATFAAEVQALQGQTGTNIYLIYVDCGIAAEYYIPNDGKSFRKKILEGIIKPQGGGGTDMRVGIARAKELGSKLTIIATDAETPFPKKQDIKGMKLIWCVNTNYEVPKHCGQVIRIPEER